MDSPDGELSAGENWYNLRVLVSSVDETVPLFTDNNDKLVNGLSENNMDGSDNRRSYERSREKQRRDSFGDEFKGGGGDGRGRVGMGAGGSAGVSSAAAAAAAAAATEKAAIARAEPTPIETFEEMGFDDTILRGIFSKGFEYPSVVQQLATKPVMDGHDVIAQAQSGTGKTASFSLGALSRIDTGSVLLCAVSSFGTDAERLCTVEFTSHATFSALQNPPV